MTVAFRPLSDVIGLEVIGVDPTGLLDDATFVEIERRWLEYNLLLFRDVRMTPPQQIALTRRFGALHIMTSA